MGFARLTFLFAAIQGLLAWSTGYFIELLPGVVRHQPIGAPEYYYGFLGAVLAWQVAFLLIAHDPRRWRPLMLIATLEKLLFFGACLALLTFGRIPVRGLFIGGMIDGGWMALFIVSWLLTKPAAAPA